MYIINMTNYKEIHLLRMNVIKTEYFVALILTFVLRPCPGPTGRCTPVLGRREEGLPRRVQDVRVAKIPECSKGRSLHSTNQNEGTIICNGLQN